MLSVQVQGIRVETIARTLLSLEGIRVETIARTFQEEPTAEVAAAAAAAASAAGRRH